ncbi:MAG: DUF131 domain-containing protein [Candidatus Nanoarchaeia archaeon]|nr:DUF131 domain-containing protein [Candidatus Aenigmarchaeota archaeon]MCW1309383.1 DUF131 domain-containing protein [Candidatus Jingweiarchaeum tengchongense]
MLKLIASNSIMIAGVVLIFIGILLILFSLIIGETTGRTKFSIGGFIGPLVFGFGNDPKMVRFAVIVSLIMLALFLAFLFLRI